MAPSTRRQKKCFFSFYTHISATRQHDLLTLLTECDELFDSILHLWYTKSVNLNLKKGTIYTTGNPIHYPKHVLRHLRRKRYNQFYQIICKNKAWEQMLKALVEHTQSQWIITTHYGYHLMKGNKNIYYTTPMGMVQICPLWNPLISRDTNNWMLSILQHLV